MSDFWGERLILNILIGILLYGWTGIWESERIEGEDGRNVGVLGELEIDGQIGLVGWRGENFSFHLAGSISETLKKIKSIVILRLTKKK